MNELEEIENGPCYQSGDNDPVNPTFHVRMKNPRISWGFA